MKQVFNYQENYSKSFLRNKNMFYETIVQKKRKMVQQSTQKQNVFELGGKHE